MKKHGVFACLFLSGVLLMHCYVQAASITAGGEHSFKICNNGTVWAWGNNVDGQLGIGGTDIGTNLPVQVPIIDVSSLAATLYHSLAVKNDGTVWAWGNNANGQLGTGTNLSTNLPVQVTGLSDVVAASCGGRKQRIFSCLEERRHGLDLGLQRRGTAGQRNQY